MRILVLISTFLLIGNFDAQSSSQFIDEKFEEYMLKADSMNYKSDSLKFRLDVIKKIDFYQDKLLLNNNFKNEERASEIIDSFNELVGLKYDYKKVTKDEKTIIFFFSNQKLVFKGKINVEIATFYWDKRMEYISNKIEEEKRLKDYEENEVIEALHKANYPVNLFNKLSEPEKADLLKKIESGYIFEK